MPVAQSTIKINSLVDVIDFYQPNILLNLQDKYGYNEKNRKILKPGSTLGTKLIDSNLYLEVAEKGLRVAKERVQPNIKQLRSRLRNAKRIRVIGQIIAAITSVGLITASLTQWPEATKISTAIINFMAVICTIVANNMETPLHGGSGNLIELYESLVRVDIESELLLRKFEVYRNSSLSQDEITEIVSTSNSLAAILLSSEKYLWS